VSVGYGLSTLCRECGLWLTNKRVRGNRGGKAERGEEESDLHFGRGWCVCVGVGLLVEVGEKKLCDLRDSGDFARKMAACSSLFVAGRDALVSRTNPYPTYIRVSLYFNSIDELQTTCLSLDLVVELASLALKHWVLPRNARTILGQRRHMPAPPAD
jgi:hypothetical protein